MDIVTLCGLVLVTIVVAGAYVMGKELDLRKPAPLPQSPMSDVARAITALEVQLDRLQDEYTDNNDSDVLAEISKVNGVLATIATQSTGTMCKCGAKKS